MDLQQKSSNLFEEKDISSYNPQLIHTIRGIRLGYPSLEYFLSSFDKQSLIVSMYLNDIRCYAYTCPLTEGSGCQAVSMWFKFKPFAMATGYRFILKMHEGQT